MYVERYLSIEKWAQELDGVFTLADLKVALDVDSEATLYRTLLDLTDKGALVKVKRGLYAVPNASLEVISSRIEPNAYISTGTVLARHAIIGSIPARKVQAVKQGRPRTYQCSLGVIEHLSIAPRLYFGFSSKKGRRVATPEKAFLDVCYFRYKGKTFSFDPASDVNLEDLDFKIIKGYLKQYDPRFVAFFDRIWSAQ
jgi:predicted transcriptional regulator of viral defense system